MPEWVMRRMGLLPTIYRAPDGGAGTGGGATGGDGGSGDGGTGDGGAGGSAGGSPRTFTQADIDRAVAETRRKFQEDVRKKTQRITELEATVGTSAEDAAALRAEKEELDRLLMSEKEARAQALETERTQAKAKIQAAEQARDEATRRFHTSLISTEISNLAVTYGAKHPADFRDLLFGRTFADPIKDDKGNETGQFVVRVRSTKKDEATGKMVDVTPTLEEYVKELHADPTRAYLFNSQRVGGTGAGVPVLGPNGIALDKMSTDERLRHGMAQKMKRT